MSNRRNATCCLSLLILSVVLLATACRRDAGVPLARVRAPRATGPLRVNPLNRRYFTDASGKAVYLTGAHTWANLLDRGSQNPPKVSFDYAAYINWMVSHNFNFMRLWTEELPNHGKTEDPYDSFVGLPWKWVRTGPGDASDGGPKFDFDRQNQDYFDRMRSRIIAAGNSGIYVSVMLFNGFEWQFETNPNDGNPFQASNNVNAIDCPMTCPTDNSRISS